MVCHVFRPWDPQHIKLYSDSQQWKRFQHGASTGRWIWIYCNDLTAPHIYMMLRNVEHPRTAEYRNIIKNRTQVFVNSAKWQGGDVPIEHTELPTNMFLWFYVFNAPWSIARLEKIMCPPSAAVFLLGPSSFAWAAQRSRWGVFQQWMG